MKTFLVTIRLLDNTWEANKIKAEKIVIGTHGAKLQDKENNIVAFIPFDKLIDVVESESLSKDK